MYSELLSMMLTTGEVTHVFGVHANTVRRGSDKGIIKPTVSVHGGKRRFRQDDVTAFFLERAIRRYSKA
jgi:DNA-binding transcriptional MerR regulator